MLRKFGSFFLALVMSFMLVPVIPQAAAAAPDDASATSGVGTSVDESQDYEQGQAIVCFRTGSAEAGSSGSLSTYSDDGLEYEVILESTAADNASAEGLSTQSEEDPTTLTLVKSDSMSTAEIVAKMEARDDVEFAEPDYLVKTGWDDESADATSAEDADDTLTTQATTFTPKGDYSQFQWGLDNEGNILEGTSGCDVDNTDGLKGSDDVVVAVVDSGVDSDNANLSGQMINLANYGTLMSDTGAGTYGYNAYSSSATADHTQLYDTVGHGTHVAGIIGADGGSTGTGAHGVMQDVTLVCVKLCDSNHDDYIPESSMIRGFGWLINAKKNYGMNVCAANLSVGSDTAYQSLKVTFQALEDAGIILCTSAGNSSEDTSLYSNMAALSKSGSTVVVDAMDPDGSKASYSDYGPYTDVFAPGTDVYSTTSSRSPYACFNSFRAQADGTSYIYEGFEGTGKTDVTQVENPAVTSSGTKLYTYDAAATDSKGAEVTSRSRYRHFLGDSCFTTYVPAEGTTLVSDVFDLSSVGDWSQIGVGLSACSAQGTYVCIDFRLKDGTFTSEFTKVFASSSWNTISPTVKRALSTIDNLDTQHFQMKITLKPAIEGRAAGTTYIDALGVGSGFAGYTFMSGTSMASPMTTGVAGLLCAEFAGKEATTRTAARVVGGAQQTSALAGACRSGGMVDVHKAYTNPDPVIQKTACDNGKLVLSGWFLGNTTGTVTVGGTTATVESWTADTAYAIGTVTVDVPDGLSGYQNVIITSADNRAGYRNTLVQTSITDFEELKVPQAAAGTAYDLVSSATVVPTGDNISLVTCSKDVTEEQQVTFGVWSYDASQEASSENPWTRLDSGFNNGHKDVGLISACFAAGKIWIIAGEPYTFNMMLSGETPYSTMLSFDMTSKTWTQYDIAGYPVLPTLVSWNDTPYCIGGYLVNESLPSLNQSVLKIDTSSGSVTKVATLDKVPSMFAAMSGDDLIGMNDSNTLVTDFNGIDESNPDKTLSQQSYDLACEFTANHDNTAAFCGTSSGAVFSGYGTVADSTDTWVFDKSTGIWTQSAKRLSYETTSSVAGTTFRDAVYVWGKVRDSSSITFFRKLALHEVTATVTPEGSGTVAGACAVEDGGNVTLSATPAKGFHFLRWMEGSEVLGTNATLSLSDISSDRSVTAVFEADPSKWSRLSGDSRYATMAEIVDKGFEDGSCPVAILATGTDFPDALAASGLAGLNSAPLVLIDGKLSDADAINASKAFAEFDRLGVKDVVVTGGSASVSDEIFSALTAKFGSDHVTRAYGSNRVETSLAIYKAGKTVAHGSATGWGKTVVVATGANFADALSISPFSYATSSPIILTDNDGNLSSAAMTVIADGGFEHAVIVGGYAAVTGSSQTWLASQFGDSEVVRLGGLGRYSTSVAIAQFECGQGLYTAYPAQFGYTALSFASPCVSTGQSSPDGLAGGTLCGKHNSVLLLVDDESKTGDAERGLGIIALESNKDAVVNAFALGGTSTISEALYDTLCATTG